MEHRERIPRKIHYVWLGGKPVPRRLQRCIDSWRRVMPDYELVCWNEERFDIHSLPFVEQTYKAGKWSFASDYIRFYAVYREGGIYLDTDVRVFRRFDRFLQHRAFSAACYVHQLLPTGERDPFYCVEAECIGAERGHPWLKRCMQAFEGRDYRLSHGLADVGIGPTVATHALPEGSWQGNVRIREPLLLPEGIVIYPEATFAWLGGDISFRHTHSLHLGVGSWVDDGDFSKRDLFFRLRRMEDRLLRRFTLYAFLHYRRKRLQRGLGKLLGLLRRRRGSA